MSVEAVRLPGIPVGVRFVSNLETLKWFALVGMVANHWCLYVLSEAPPRLFDHVGATVFPLFCIALASGLCLKHEDYAWRILPRVFGFAIVSQVLMLLVRDGIPLNVIFTLGLGLWAQLIWHSDHSLLRRSANVFGILTISVFCEFPIVGVLFIWSLLEAFRSERAEMLAAPVIILSMLSPFNAGSHAALLVPLLVLAVAALPFDFPRVRRFFYWIYAGQFPVYWIGAQLWGG